jgi:hypothetical protein
VCGWAHTIGSEGWLFPIVRDAISSCFFRGLFTPYPLRMHASSVP